MIPDLSYYYLIWSIMPTSNWMTEESPLYSQSTVYTALKSEWPIAKANHWWDRKVHSPEIVPRLSYNPFSVFLIHYGRTDVSLRP